MDGGLVRPRRYNSSDRPIAPHETAFQLGSAFDGKRVLVTGGAGFVGSHIVDQLAAAGCDEIVVVDNMTRGRLENLIAAMRSGRVHIVVGDIRNDLLLQEVLAGIDIVFHQVELRADRCAMEPRAALEVMVDATFDLFEQCVKSGVGKIVMASSALVYGMAESFPTMERHSRCANRTLYGAAKYFGEALLRAFNDMYGIHYAALRYFDVYGPRMDISGPHTEMLISWTERLAVGLPPIIFGDGTQTMDLVQVEDVARASLLAAVAPMSDVVLNIGSGKETSILALARQLCNIMGRPDIEPIFWEQRSGDMIERRLANTAVARRTIGFEAAIPLATGLADFVDWWRSQSAASSCTCG
jgi:UDP-glucose 4-epimerase